MTLTQITEKGIKDGEIVNADINASAAIAGTKISPDFGSQNITTTGRANIAHDLTITGTAPRVILTDTDHNSDFRVNVDNGLFSVQDTSNSNVSRLEIGSNGRFRVGCTAQPSSTVGGFQLDMGSYPGTMRLSSGAGASGTDSASIQIAGSNHNASLTHGSNYGGQLNLYNYNTTDGNSTAISFHNSNSLSSSRVVGNNSSHSSRTGNLVFMTSNGTHPEERMRIDNLGRVMVGTTSPQAILTLNNTNQTTQTLLHCEDVGGSGVHSHIAFKNTTGDVASINTNSDNLEFRVDDATVFSNLSGTENMRIASNGKVGINITGTDNTHPVRNLDIADSSGAILRLISSDDSLGANERVGEIEFFTDDDDAAHISSFIKAIAEGSDAFGRRGALTFGTRADSGNATEKVRIDHNGKVAIGHTSPAANLDVKTAHASNEANFLVRNNTVNYKVRTLSDQVQAGAETNHPFYAISNNQYVARFDGDGIKFGSDTAAANALSDYEIGTHTPVPTSGGVNSGVTDGQYTKIGQFCIYVGSITLDGNANNSLMMGFSLPFTAASGRAGSGVIRYSNQSYADTITLHVDAGQASVHLYQFGGSTYSYLEAGTSRYDFCITYRTSS